MCQGRCRWPDDDPKFRLVNFNIKHICSSSLAVQDNEMTINRLDVE